MLYNRTLLFFPPVCNSLHLLIPNSCHPPTVPPPRPPHVCSLCLWVCFCYVLACPTLWVDPMDCSPPGTSVHGVSQARVLEWAAISFSRDLLHPGIELKPPASPALVGRFFTTEPPGKSTLIVFYSLQKEGTEIQSCYKPCLPQQAHGHPKWSNWAFVNTSVLNLSAYSSESDYKQTVSPEFKSINSSTTDHLEETWKFCQHLPREEAATQENANHKAEC